MLLNTLICILILYGVGMLLVVLVLIPAVALLFLTAHAIWVERTGGFKMIVPKPPTPGWTKQKTETPGKPQTAPLPANNLDDKDVPDGFKGHYSYYTDPRTGRRSLLPLDEIEAMQREDEADQTDEEYADLWVDGREPVMHGWKEGMRSGNKED